MNKLKNLIDRLPFEDLVKIQKDLKTGNLERLIGKRIEDIQPTKTQLCPVCNAKIDANSNLTIIFGPADFRQKASFDGPDCLIYFLDRLKNK